jgi:hypothetical protein
VAHLSDISTNITNRTDQTNRTNSTNLTNDKQHRDKGRKSQQTLPNWLIRRQQRIVYNPARELNQRRLRPSAPASQSASKE